MRSSGTRLAQLPMGELPLPVAREIRRISARAIYMQRVSRHWCPSPYNLLLRLSGRGRMKPPVKLIPFPWPWGPWSLNSPQCVEYGGPP